MSLSVRTSNGSRTSALTYPFPARSSSSTASGVATLAMIMNPFFSRASMRGSAAGLSPPSRTDGPIVRGIPQNLQANTHTNDLSPFVGGRMMSFVQPGLCPGPVGIVTDQQSHADHADPYAGCLPRIFSHPVRHIVEKGPRRRRGRRRRWR